MLDTANTERRRGWTTTVLLGAAAIAVSIAAKSGATRNLDEQLRAQQPHPRRGPMRTASMRIRHAAKPEAPLLLSALLSTGLALGRVRGAERIVGATFLAFMTDTLCKHVAPRERPSGYRGRKKRNQSFPSGHVTVNSAFAFSTARVLLRAGLVPSGPALASAALVTAAIGESRLVLDEHWPSDVLAGALIGTTAAWGATSW